VAKSLGPILAATVVVPNLNEAIAAYRDLLGHARLAHGRLDEELALAWGQPQLAGSSWCVLGPTSATGGLVRLVEAPGAPRPATFRTLGWVALEILVASADETWTRCLEVPGFEVLQKPSTVGATGSLRALQAVGPGGEGVYLTQVVRASDLFDLPTLDTGRHLIYVVVVGTRDVDVTRHFFESVFGVPRVTDHPLPVKVLNQAYDLPSDSLHRISTVQLAGTSVIEIDEYPPSASSRPPRSSGLTIVTFAGRCPEDESVHSLSKRAEPPYWGAQACTVTGPFGLRIEVVQR